ncbi:ubiquitin carboxyl-terminal hydrolase 2-like protein [Powellomyces hirtus]|nr:ubiquitin carboxyl-terminal hydrolase 2-like protein [Powellomyces hirtus]
MNSILQCMFAAEHLMGYVLSSNFAKEVNTSSPTKGKLALAFSELVLKIMQPGNDRAIAPSRFKEHLEDWAPQFVGYDQQDAQEFLRFLLDGLHEDLNRVRERPRFNYKDADVDRLSDIDKARFAWNRYHAANDSTIFNLFGGQFMSTITCSNCKKKSRTFETFWDLSLPIPKSSYRSGLAGDGECTLLECLAEFASEEVLEAPYKCDACNGYHPASKSLRIHQCPEILVIHLKRFSYSTYSRSKIECDVQFPVKDLTLDGVMSNLEESVIRYDLFGVSNHIGSLNGGHYVAHIRNFDDDKWYKKNDASVSLCSNGPASAFGSSAYVIFYTRRR